MHKLGVGFASPEAPTSALSTDHTALQNNRHVSHPHADLGTDLPGHLKPLHGSLQSPPLSGTQFFFSHYQTERWGRPDVSRSPSTSNTGVPVLAPQPFLHRGWDHPGQEIPASHSPHPALCHPDPRAGLHPDLQARAQLPLEDLEFSYHKRTSLPLSSLPPAPLGKAELFLENSRVCS